MKNLLLLSIVLLSSCDTNQSKDIAVQHKTENDYKGKLSFKEALNKFDDKNSSFKFYEEGHYYRCFLKVEYKYSEYAYSITGIVHDPDCPCQTLKKAETDEENR